MKILHTSDWHLGKNLERESRLPEQEEFVQFFVQTCNEIQPDLIIIAGDIYDSSNPPAKAEKLFYDTLKRLSRGGKCLTLIIAGNHDNPERLTASWPIAMEHGIIMLGTPKTVVEIGNYGNQKLLSSGEGFVEVEINGEKAVIITVPYPSEKRLNEVIYRDGDDEKERLQSYADKIESLFLELEKNFREDSINITTTHLFAFGSEPSGSERAGSLGGSFLVGTNILPQSAQYTALGHIHKPQILPGTNQKMRYCGAPIHYDKSEPSGNKKMYVIDVHPGQEAIISEVEIPIFKPIEIWKAESIQEAIHLCQERSQEKSWVYLEVKTDRYIREDEIKSMKAYKKDILEIVPIIEGTLKSRQQDKIEELSFKEQFVEFYQSMKNTAPEEEMVDLLLSLLEEEEMDETDEANH